MKYNTLQGSLGPLQTWALYPGLIHDWLLLIARPGKETHKANYAQSSQVKYSSLQKYSLGI